MPLAAPVMKTLLPRTERLRFNAAMRGSLRQVAGSAPRR
jgi:hypothetical protein